MYSLKIKILLVIVFFLGSPGQSYARFEIRDAVFRFCEAAFVSRENKNAPTNAMDSDVVKTVKDAVSNSIKKIKLKRKRKKLFQSLMENIHQEEELEKFVQLQGELEYLELKEIRRKVKKGEVKVTQQTRETEEELTEKGFGSFYTKGLDEMNEMIAIVKQLRELEVDSYTTHVGYFSDKITENIQFMETGEITSFQRIMLTLLKEYVKTATQEESVTYEKFLRFHEMLVNIFSNNSGEVLQSFRNFTVYFPKIIAMPTVQGEVGIMTINKGMEEGVSVFGLVKEDAVPFFNHDLGHATSRLWIVANNIISKKMKTVRKQKENLPLQKRENVELVHWILDYEIMIHVNSQEHIKEKVTSFFSSEGLRKQVADIMDISSLSKEKVRKITNDFIKFYISVGLQFK